MTEKITKGDIKILSYIAEYRVLTYKQLSAITERSLQVVRRRMQSLNKQGLVMKEKHGLGKGPGAPELITFITDKGVGLLESKEIIPSHTSYLKDKDLRLIFIDHELLVNWSFIHLHHIEREGRPFKVRHLKVISHDLSAGDSKQPLIMERISSAEKAKESNLLIPDGVFVITCTASEKTLLFFLEVDRGTETLVKSNHTPGDIRHKIISYQALFRSRHYKRYEKVFNAELNGFRLLFLTTTPGRAKSICELVQMMAPSDFIWVTDQSRMFSNGISAEIWSRGGCYDKASESILGHNLAFDSPVLDTLK